MILIEKMNVQLRVDEKDLSRYLQDGYKEVKKKETKKEEIKEDKLENKENKKK